MSKKTSPDLDVILCNIEGNIIEDISKVKFSDDILQEFARSIDIADIKKYLEEHQEEYEKWLKDKSEK